MLLLFFNYLEIAFAYAVFYSIDRYLNRPFFHWFDAIYFSIVTSSSIGYGDYYPLPQSEISSYNTSLTVSVFHCAFLEFLFHQSKTKGYFDHENLEITAFFSLF
jgi:hypothetical protein